MVKIKANKAIGSILGLGTHTWLEIHHNGEKLTYSGSKGKDNILLVLKNFKRDYDRDAPRGEIEIPAPESLTDAEWAAKVIESAEKVLTEMHQKYHFCGVFPHGIRGGLPRANCCTVLNKIISATGEEIPSGKIKGFTPGLH